MIDRSREASLAQPPLIEALLQPEAYPHPAADIELHETHGAWVVLAGAYAYKLKKPVNLGFLDFSTPERRAADAEAEVRLNRRFAPGVYLGVVDIVERDGAIRVGGEGVVLERAVWMQRLPADGMLSVLLDREEVTPPLVREIAHRVAAFHATAPTGPGVDEHGSQATITANWEENLDQVSPFVGGCVPAEHVERIRWYVHTFLSEHATAFASRVAQGKIRDGHGDLHAQSICVTTRGIVIFDCLEFSARYRCADVAAEIAFLAMDLDHAGRPDLAWEFVNAYLGATGDREALLLLDFYKCYRAFVRGKVLAMRLAQAGVASEEQEEIRREARGYFDLALRYTGALSQPLLLTMCGLPASGKSTLAHELAGRLGLVVLATDVFRKQRAGLRTTQHEHTSFGSGLYGASATQATYHALRRAAGRWLRRGVGVILDGTFTSRDERRLARALARRTGARFLLVTTTCRERMVRERLAARVADPAQVSDATWTTYQAMQRLATLPDDIPQGLQCAIATDEESLDAAVNRVLAHLAGAEYPASAGLEGQP